MSRSFAVPRRTRLCKRVCWVLLAPRLARWLQIGLRVLALRHQLS